MPRGARDVTPAPPAAGAWPAATAAQEAWDLGALSAEMDALAVINAPRLPLPLLAPGLAAAAAADSNRGGPLVLVELPLDQPLVWSGDAVAQCIKLGVLLRHPADLSVLCMDGFTPVQERNGAVSHGGTRVVMISHAFWEPDLACVASDELRLRFWLREARFELMRKEAWVVMPIATDTYCPACRRSRCITDAKVIRRV